MKISKLKFVLTAVFTSSCLMVSAAQARTVAYTCEASDQQTLNRFTGSGLVEISKGKADGSFSGAVTLGGSTTSIEVSALDTKGDARIIPAGEFAVNEVIVLQLQATRNDNKATVHMSFNLGVNNATSSTLIVDSVPYRAHCYEVQ